jgi:hypothetical protein
MSSKILIKRSTTSGSVPTTSDLDTGELGLNTADKRVYTNNAGTIVELGTYPSSLNVTGNTDLDGTLNVDGASTLASGTVSGNWTVTGTLTVSTPTNSTDAASKGYVDTAVANVIDSAPAALDTLNELAAALNDDANFATTVTTALATKLPLAGGTMTGDIVLGTNKITTTADPATDNSLTRKSYVDDILGSATAAADSATAAATSATNAANSATSASGSATTATTQATAASSSASNASTSETNAATSATSAANSATAAATSATNAATSESNASDSESAAATSETNAATSASSASTSATSASNSATSAASSATTATTKASEASTSASNASTSETNAAASASAAATSETNAASSASAASSDAASVASLYDQFDDRYLGSKASAPSVDNDGNALLTGALYWDTTASGLYVYNGSSWEIAGDRDELLQAIAASKADTAVDVFVYDTRKDSDGGAWRKRTQHTSWYNETLNTATRGSRKEFPAVAVIVAESDAVTIYDGDDPSLPMWMVFPADAYITWASATDTGTSCVSALNSKLFIGNANGFGGCIVDFVSDDTKLLYNNNNYALTKRTVVDRNILESAEFPLYYSGGDGYNIVNNRMTDVAMTVLPNAPIDSATGLPVPTIAVATDGGVSVIKDDGTVVDITTTYNTNNSSNYIDFTSDNRLYFTSRGKNYPIVADIPSSDISVPQSNDVIFWPSAIIEKGLDQVTINNTNINDIAAASGRSISFGGPKGLIYAQDIKNISADKTAVFAQITSDFNTGYQNGDIKLATLSDTDDTDVTGTELVTNGTFDTDTTGWSADSGVTLSISSGELVVTTTSGYLGAYQAITVEVGRTYTYSVDETAGTPYHKIGYSAGSSEITHSTNSPITTFTPTNATIYIWVGVNLSGAGTATFDNVSVRLAEQDRSVNGNGLQVFGTVTKNPVATGADLVAYSGFSSSNYLQQPSYGLNQIVVDSTQEFTLNFWLNAGGADLSSVSLIEIASASDGPDEEQFLRFQTNASSEIGLWARNTSGAARYVGTIPTDSPVFISYCYNGNYTFDIYVNGSLAGTTSTVSGYWPTVTSDLVLTIGATLNGLSNISASTGMSLVRFSETKATAEQIAKIYEDEKVLFQENAQATLYGSSDAVTALAYDDDTELLHVGTSAGRSDFSGLRRVSNTTDAVGAAISASNGLIAED